jgi:hypothetical protein
MAGDQAAHEDEGERGRRRYQRQPMHRAVIGLLWHLKLEIDSFNLPIPAGEATPCDKIP